MKTKEKANWELTLKNILYFVDDTKDQEEMINILKKYNDQLPDGKLKDKIQNIILNNKKTYYEKVDFLISDILNGGNENDRKKILTNMLNEIKPTVEKAERNLWDKICDLFKWS